MNISVNSISVPASSEVTNEWAAARELLRQRAVVCGLLEALATDDATIDQTIETLLAREVVTPEPTEEECRRYYESHQQEFHSGDLVHARHILFQVTPSVSVPEIRVKAEQTLNELLREPDRFDAVAREMSNCPSGQQGGNLGQISRGDTVPEFEKALFKFSPTGILGEVIKTRYGFHIVAIDRRILGVKLPFDAVHSRVAERLKTTVEEKALRQYISMLAGDADVRGVDLAASVSPLVQ